MTETSEDAFERAAAAGIALKREYPATHAEHCVRDAALVEQHGRLVAEARRMITASRANGNGHAPAPAKAEQSHGLTKTEISALAKGLMTWLGAQFRGMARELGKEFAERDRRIAALEARPGMKYTGVWDPERSYAVGDFVTDDGSSWHCDSPCAGVRPGSAAGVWTLAVKRGRDGKSGR